MAYFTQIINTMQINSNFTATMAYNNIFTWFQSSHILLGHHSNTQTDKTEVKDTKNSLDVDYSKHKTFKFEPMDKQKALEVVTKGPNNTQHIKITTKTYEVNIDTFPNYKTIISEKQEFIKHQQKIAEIIKKQKLDEEKQITLSNLAKFNVYKPIVDELINKWSKNIIPIILGKIQHKFQNTELNAQYKKTKPAVNFNQQMTLKYKYLKQIIAKYSISFLDIGKLIDDNIKFTDIESEHWNKIVFNDMIISKFKDELDNIREYIIKILYEKGYPEVNIDLIDNYNYDDDKALALIITNYKKHKKA